MLQDYVLNHTERGACTCGKCIDAPIDPASKQPNGHTLDITFFKVKSVNDANAQDFLSLVKSEFPQWLDGAEHSYLQIGGDVGDQGIALMTIGLGHLLGVWKALCPETLMPFLDDAMKQQMAGMGMISLQFKAPAETKEELVNMQTTAVSKH